ncbi:hypothetical protein [Streptomyces sp. NPDC014995]|uniref:hypothetical protein n=1 Tax=Streptomyces sp. NPDC014995 TaxID=3364936 RepID=UPI0036FE2134
MPGKTLICATASAALLLSPALASASDADDLTARQLATQAKDNLLAAGSVRLGFTDRSPGVNDSRTRPAAMDVAMDRDGNCAGTMTMAAKGGGVEIVKRGKQVWMKPDTAFWKAQLPGGQGDRAAELFKNRYIHGSTDDTLLKGMADICDLSRFQKDAGTGTSGGTTLTKGKETTRDGTRVVPLHGTTEDGRRTTLHVTADAPHRLVAATRKDKDTDVTLSFSDYGKPVPTRTPPANETVDIGKLEEQLLGG